MRFENLVVVVTSGRASQRISDSESARRLAATGCLTMDTQVRVTRGTEAFTARAADIPELLREIEAVLTPIDVDMPLEGDFEPDITPPGSTEAVAQSSSTNLAATDPSQNVGVGSAGSVSGQGGGDARLAATEDAGPTPASRPPMKPSAPIEPQTVTDVSSSLRTLWARKDGEGQGNRIWERALGSPPVLVAVAAVIVFLAYGSFTTRSNRAYVAARLEDGHGELARGEMLTGRWNADEFVVSEGPHAGDLFPHGRVSKIPVPEMIEPPVRASLERQSTEPETSEEVISAARPHDTPASPRRAPARDPSAASTSPRHSTDRGRRTENGHPDVTGCLNTTPREYHHLCGSGL